MSSILREPNLKMVAAGSGSGLLGNENAGIILGEALDLSGAEKPTVLTIGTAEPTKSDYDTFVANTTQKFGELGANVVDLHEFGKMPSRAELEDKIAGADTIWVAGGNTQGNDENMAKTSHNRSSHPGSPSWRRYEWR